MDAHTIAEKLTKAQRREFLRHKSELGTDVSGGRRSWSAGAWRNASSPTAAAALFRLGLLERKEVGETDRFRGTGTSDRWRWQYGYHITPLGLEVRNILLNGEGK